MDLFKQFLKDEEAWEFYITGVAGTGKTTSLAEYISLCNSMGIPNHTCAYTHKACGVLRNKLPEDSSISTLHSFLQKRPTINTEAKTISKIESNQIFGTSEKKAILFIDEFSQIGESDLMDLRNLQDPDYDGDVAMKIVWIGDPYQLPPVKDMEAVIPQEPYWVRLTEIKRTDKDNLLQQTIKTVVEMLEGKAQPAALPRHEQFRCTVKLVDEYITCKDDKVFLAYTNKRVQDINFTVMDKESPDPGDKLFCSNVNEYFHLIRKVPSYEITKIDRFWDDPLEFGSKYKTLEFIIENNMCEFFEVVDEDGEQFIYPVIFGTYNHKQLKAELGEEATRANLLIQNEFKAQPTQWAKANYNHPLARKRAAAWRKYLTMKDFACMDFSHAMTVHKSQGSTYHTVFLDADDLSLCMQKNFNLYLRLYYVAISRASKLVWTN